MQKIKSISNNNALKMKKCCIIYIFFIIYYGEYVDQTKLLGVGAKFKAKKSI